MRRDTGPGRRESVLHLKLPVGIGPTTYVLREAREYATQVLTAQTARWVAREALIALGFRAFPVHVPVHAKSVTSRGNHPPGVHRVDRDAVGVHAVDRTEAELALRGGCSVMPVNQVRSGAVAVANVDQVRCGETKRGLVLPGADTAGGQLIGDEPVPEQAQHLPRDAAWEETWTARQHHRHRYLITGAVA